MKAFLLVAVPGLIALSSCTGPPDRPDRQGQRARAAARLMFGSARPRTGRVPEAVRATMFMSSIAAQAWQISR
jgi:hypothetical protein